MGERIKKVRIRKFIIFGILVSIVIGGIVLNKSFITTINSQLIYEEEISPNKEYVKSKKDIILYKIKVYQKKDNTIIIKAMSNMELFENMIYEIEYNKKISNSDVKITWANLMGNQNFAKDDQIIQANVEFLSDGKVFYEERVNYAENLIKSLIK